METTHSERQKANITNQAEQAANQKKLEEQKKQKEFEEKKLKEQKDAVEKKLSKQQEAELKKQKEQEKLDQHKKKIEEERKTQITSTATLKENKGDGKIGIMAKAGLFGAIMLPKTLTDEEKVRLQELTKKVISNFEEENLDQDSKIVPQSKKEIPLKAPEPKADDSNNNKQKLAKEEELRKKADEEEKKHQKKLEEERKKLE